MSRRSVTPAAEGAAPLADEVPPTGLEPGAEVPVGQDVEEDPLGVEVIGHREGERLGLGRRVAQIDRPLERTCLEHRPRIERLPGGDEDGVAVADDHDVVGSDPRGAGSAWT